MYWIIQSMSVLSKPSMYDCSDLTNIRLRKFSISACCSRAISQTVFMLSIAINRAEHVCATVIVIIKHNYMLMCNHKIVIYIMLCLLNRTGHI